jgi:hypothetical protein
MAKSATRNQTEGFMDRVGTDTRGMGCADREALDESEGQGCRAERTGARSNWARQEAVR